ncbi:exonuclease SbcCD subunit D [Paenactinomyces guangxiensis]|uniref:DNA repair exonuclease n=1 Tax=Paenactinomyces guangxiensis TaxID=1490290 RepID=A0A7W1WN67_9BACL|nr:DNA repair exonuclease [Paenactinomyces guangxiensis]MBA4492967.1 DNA repair exonuclease [Paenactinomyces guangxiensis]MBH8590184.1 DNA repair exonuclease [Paenactinomyces guangxiensis]
MKPVTWVHTADLHLDEPIRGWKGTRENAWKRSLDFRETFARVIGLTDERKADFLLIAGDFLEHGYVSKSTVRFVQEQFSKIPGTQVLIAPGNHDPYRPDSVYCLEKWPDNVHIFSEEWETLYYPEYDLRVYGRGFADFKETNWIAPDGVHGEGKKIMVIHGDYLQQEGTSFYFPVPDRELSSLEMDYVALGHIHKAADYRLNNCRRTWIRYPGSPEALNWKEIGERTVTFGTLDEAGVKVEPIAIHTRTYEKHRLDVKGCETKEEVVSRILKVAEKADKHSYHLFELAGRRSRELDLSEGTLHWMEDYLRKEGYEAVYFQDETKPDFDLDYYRQQPGVVGTFIRKIEERIRQEPGRRDEYERALYKGLEALLAKENVFS